MKGNKGLAVLIGIVLMTACSGGKHTVSGIVLAKAPDATSEWVGTTTRRINGWGDADIEIQIIGSLSGPKPEQRKLLKEVFDDFDRFFILAATEIVKDDADFLKSIEHLKARTQSISWHCDAAEYETTPKWSLQFTILAEGDHEMGMFAEFEGKRFLQVIGVD